MIARRLVIVAFGVLAMGAKRPAPISVEGAWTRPAMVGGTAAGYLTIVNHGRLTDNLVSASSPLAARVTVHQSRRSGGIVSMIPVAILPIPAAGRIALSPGGYHLMIQGLKRPLALGDRLPVVLTFTHAGSIAANLDIRNGPDPMAGMKM